MLNNNRNILSDFGATFTYYLKEAPKNKKQVREKKEKDQSKNEEKIDVLSMDDLRNEAKEEKPHLIFTIYDQDIKVVKVLRTSTSKGIKRFTWSLRNDSPRAVILRGNTFNPLDGVGWGGYLVMPGVFKVGLEESVTILQTLYQWSGATQELITKSKKVRKELDEISFVFKGHSPKASFEEVPPGPMPLHRRLSYLSYTHSSSKTAITQIEKDTYSILMGELPPLIKQLKKSEEEILAIQKEMKSKGAHWTPGQTPDL